VLSAEQRADYERDGFLVLRDFVSEAACAELKRRAEALVDDFEPDEGVRSIFTTNEQTRHSDEYFLTSGDKTRFFFEEEAFAADGELRQAKALSINKLGHAMHDLDPVFERFSHTDQTFLWTEPRSVTGFWFAIEEATLENGCLWALPGGQSIPVKSRFRRDGQGGTVMEVLDDSPYPEEGLVPLEVPAGTLVVLNGTLPHRSGPNRSDRSRHAYTLHVIERGAAYPEDNWLQRPGLPLRPVA
jgi:phytanoyl-CoA hydroxylase